MNRYRPVLDHLESAHRLLKDADETAQHVRDTIGRLIDQLEEKEVRSLAKPPNVIIFPAPRQV